MNENDDIIFDKDDALDCIMYIQLNEKKQNRLGNGGCYGTVTVLTLPILGFL